MSQEENSMPTEALDNENLDSFNDITDERTKEFTAMYEQMGLSSEEDSDAAEDPTHRPLSEEDMKQEDHDIMPDYELGDRLGRGGCAIVYEGWRKSDRFHVAIKQLAIPATADEEEEHIARRRFYREAKLITSLKEQHIVQCVDYGVMNEGQPCMVLEYIKGKELGDYLQDPVHCKSEDEQYLSIEKAVDITIQVLQGLSVSHSKTIIHRDIKPGNIMILDDSPENSPAVKVLDFGIATVIDSVDNSSTLMTQQGNIRGTPSYMAPELFTGAARASVESDLYAVGLVLLECLTNKIAFEGASFMQVAYMQVNEQPDIPSYIPECLANVIRKACAKKKDERYHSADDMISDLRVNLGQAVKEYPRCLARYRNQKEPSALSLFWQAHKKQFFIGGASVLGFCVLLFIGFVVLLFVWDPEPDEMDAEAQAALEAANAEKAELAAKAQAQQEAMAQELLATTRDMVHDKVRSSWNNTLVIFDVTADSEWKKIEDRSATAKVIENQRNKGHRTKTTTDDKTVESGGKKTTPRPPKPPKPDPEPVQEQKPAETKKQNTMVLPTGLL